MRQRCPLEQDAIVGEAGKALAAASNNFLWRVSVGRRLVMHRRMVQRPGLARPRFMIPFKILQRDAELLVRQRLQPPAESLLALGTLFLFRRDLLGADLLDDRRQRL